MNAYGLWINSHLCRGQIGHVGIRPRVVSWSYLENILQGPFHKNKQEWIITLYLILSI